MKKVFIVLLLYAVTVLPLYSLEEEGYGELYLETVSTDIETSNFYELTDWCRRLGLPIDGSKDELKNRLYGYYGVNAAPSTAAGSGGKQIEIEKADNLDYFTIEKIDENYARITGDVLLKLSDESKNETHVIRADSILFNFEENTITASGNIRYTLEGETKTENFSGDKLTFNVDSSAGLFDKGVTEQEKTINKGTDEAEEIIFYFKGDLINKTEENYVVLESGEITSCDFDDPHFMIRARKLWLITSNEWAILNGVIHIGRVPVFYFPAFIYGGDDMFFNPVFGYMDDFGGYLQTTTYLIGRKADDPDTAFSFMQSDDEFNYLKREGLYLTRDEHPDEGSKAVQDYGRDSKNYLKILLDYYTTLGIYSAVDMKLSKPSGGEENAFPAFVNSLFSVFKKNELYLSAARTRKIENTGLRYSALFPNDDGVYSSIWQNSFFLDTEIPFRYGFDYSTSVELWWFDLNISMNMYSDRDYTVDFFKRSENLDLLSFIDPEDESDTDGNKTTSAKWDADLKFNPEISILNPYLKQLNLTAKSTLNFNSKLIDSTDEKYDDTVDYFFYPEGLDLPAVSMNIGGSILPVEQTAANEPEPEARDENRPELNAPWDDFTETQPGDVYIEGIPDAAPDIEIDIGNFWSDTDVFSNRLTYSFTPKYSNRTQYGTGDWKIPEDISFDLVDYAYRSAAVDGKLVYSANLFGALLDIDNTVSGEWAFNEHYNMELLSEETAEKYLEEDRQANDAQVKNLLTLSTMPLVFLDFIDKTKITYNFNSILYEYDYSTDEGSYYSEYFKPDEDFITDHKIGFILPINTGDISQELDISANLPPLKMKTSGKYKLNWGISSSEFNTSVSETDEGFEFEPLTFNEKLTVADSSLTNNISYNYSENYFEKNTTDLKLSFFNGNLTSASNLIYDIKNSTLENLSMDIGFLAAKAAFTAKNTYDYSFDQDSGWLPASEKQFLPYSASFSLNSDDDEIIFWKNRVKLDLDLNAALNMNLIRFSESNLTFKLGFNIEIYKFLDLTFKTTSINSAVYRYFPDLCSEIGVNSINPVDDLLKSFNFADINDRYESNFNLQSISIELKHDMHDWDLSLTYSGKPFVNEEGDYPVYDWENSLNIALKWKSIPDIKSEVEIDKDAVSF